MAGHVRSSDRREKAPPCGDTRGRDVGPVANARIPRRLAYGPPRSPENSDAVILRSKLSAGGGGAPIAGGSSIKTAVRFPHCAQVIPVLAPLAIAGNRRHHDLGAKARCWMRRLTNLLDRRRDLL